MTEDLFVGLFYLLFWFGIIAVIFHFIVKFW